jgi:hypothetical protein
MLPKGTIMLARKASLLAILDRAVARQLCPECGTHMEMVDCRQRYGAYYVWYRCSQRRCDGQWLGTVGMGLRQLKRVI